MRVIKHFVSTILGSAGVAVLALGLLGTATSAQAQSQPPNYCTLQCFCIAPGYQIGSCGDGGFCGVVCGCVAPDFVCY